MCWKWQTFCAPDVRQQRAAAHWTDASAAKAAGLRSIKVTDVNYAAIQARKRSRRAPLGLFESPARDGALNRFAQPGVRRLEELAIACKPVGLQSLVSGSLGLQPF